MLAGRGRGPEEILETNVNEGQITRGFDSQELLCLKLNLFPSELQDRTERPPRPVHVSLRALSLCPRRRRRVRRFSCG